MPNSTAPGSMSRHVVPTADGNTCAVSHSHSEPGTTAKSDIDTIQRELNAKFAGLRNGVATAFGAPPILGLGNAGGFKIQIQDKGNLGSETLEGMTWTLAGEATKHGAPAAVAIDIARAGVRCRAARLAGLMTIPPFAEDPEKSRPYFAALRELRATLLKEGLDPESLRELSMGMSHDFDIAVQEGATIVRLGTAIFGSRHV